MSVKLIKGCTYGMVREGVCKEIKKNLKLDKQNYVIVPDDIVTTAKKEFVRLIKKESIFGLKVLGFAELAREFVASRKQTLSGELGLIIFKSVVSENKKLLKSFARVADNDGAVCEIFKLIGILRESCISAEQLAKTGVAIGGMLGAKVEDIAILYQKYCDKVKPHYCDSSTNLQELAEHFEKCGKIDDCNFYVCDFGLMTALQLRVLESIVLAGNNVCIGVASDENADNKRIYPRFLIDFCKKMSLQNGIKVDVVDMTNCCNDDKKALVTGLFGYDTKCEMIKDVSVHSGENINLEVKGICRIIRKLVVEEGVRFKDINILCPDVDKYKGDIAREFAIFEIPYFMQTKTNLASFAVTRLLLDGVTAKKSGCHQPAMIAFAKNILLGIEKEDVGNFELFVNKYNIDKKQFLQPFVGVGEDSLLERAEKVRKKIVDLLSIIDYEVKSIAEAACSIKCFYNKIFEECQYSKYLQKVIMQEDANARRNAEIALATIFEVLDMLENVDLQCDYNVVDSIVTILKSKSIGAKKQFVDNVFITGNLKEINSPKFLFVIGANDGVIAPDSSTISLFTSSELEQLENYGVQFCPNIMDINYNSKFEAVQLLAKGQRVFVSFCQELGEPSLLVKNLCDLLGTTAQPLVGDVNNIGMDFAKYAMKIGTKTNAKRELSLYYSERMGGISSGDENVFDYLYTILGDEYRYQNLIKPKDFQYVHPTSICFSTSGDKTFASISALERYFDCPFKFYCERMLKLKKAESGKLDVLAIGSFVHRVLERLFGEYKNLDMPDEELFAIVDKLCTDTIEEKEFEVLSLCMSPNVLKNSLFKKVHYIAEKLVEIANRSKFEREYTELTFGFNDSKLPPYEIKSGDKSYFIRGKIDRIDKFGDYVAIIDYKTSSSVSYNLNNIYYGERVQLLVYLNAYMSFFSDKIPFALFYMPLPYSYSSDEVSKVFGYKGFVKNAQSVFEAFDSDFNNDNSSIPLKFDENGDPATFKTTGKYKDKNLLDYEGFRILMDYADNVVVQAIKEIESGYIEAKPSNCDNCEYGNICLSKGNAAKTRKKLTASAFSIKEETDEKNGED